MVKTFGTNYYSADSLIRTDNKSGALTTEVRFTFLQSEKPTNHSNLFKME